MLHRHLLFAVILISGCIPWALPDTEGDTGGDADTLRDVEPPDADDVEGEDADEGVDADVDGNDGDATLDADEPCEGPPSRLPIFPGAAGYGTETRAAYGGEGYPEICIVNNTSPDSDGELGTGQRSEFDVHLGSLRECVEWDQDGKIIIFETSGMIDLTTSGELEISNDFVVVAGQTAPPPGIEIRGARLVISGHDVLVQHLVIRRGPEAPAWLSDSRRDGLVVQPRDDGCPSTDLETYNVVVDHLSISWAPDINIEIGTRLYEERDCVHDVTMSNTIVAEALVTTGDFSSEGRGVMTRMVQSVFLGWNILHSNRLYNPIIYHGHTSGFIVNNLMYNAMNQPLMLVNIKEPTAFSIVGNVSRPGPQSQGSSNHLFAILTSNDEELFDPDSEIYFHDNQCGTESVVPGQTEVAMNEQGEESVGWDGISLSDEVDGGVLPSTSPLELPPRVEPMSSGAVIEHVSVHAGARPGERDNVDADLISDIEEVEGQSVHVWPVRAWEERDETERLVDRMPASIGNFPGNPHAVDDCTGYTELELWLHRCSSAVELEE